VADYLGNVLGGARGVLMGGIDYGQSQVDLGEDGDQQLVGGGGGGGHREVGHIDRHPTKGHRGVPCVEHWAPAHGVPAGVAFPLPLHRRI